MPGIMRKIDAGKERRILRMQFLNDLPCFILGAVIDKHDAALVRDQVPCKQRLILLFQALGGLMQNLLLVIARNNHIQDFRGTHFFAPFLCFACFFPDADF